MKHYSAVAMSALFFVLSIGSSAAPPHQQPSKAETATIKGKVLRSDSGEAISNSYILLMQQKTSGGSGGSFDTRTDKNGEYQFASIPAGKYVISIYAWFSEKADVPCQNPNEAKTADGGTVTVEWQWKSHAFMEIVTIKDFYIDPGQETVKNFDLFCR